MTSYFSSPFFLGEFPCGDVPERFVSCEKTGDLFTALRGVANGLRFILGPSFAAAPVFPRLGFRDNPNSHD